MHDMYGAQLATDDLFQELVPPNPRSSPGDARRGRPGAAVGTDATAQVRRRPLQQEPPPLLLLLDRLVQLRGEVAASRDLPRHRSTATAASRDIHAVSGRPGRFEGGYHRARNGAAAVAASLPCPQAPVACAVRLRLGVPIRAVRVLGADGAGVAAEQLRQQAMVAAHAADGGLGGTQLAVASHGN